MDVQGSSFAGKFAGLRIITLLGIFLIVLLTVGSIDDAAAHNTGLYNCYPRYWNQSPPDNHVIAMNQANAPKCAAVPAGTNSQQSGYYNVTWGNPDGTAWFFVQHNSDEYVQEHLDKPWCANSGTWPYCSTCGCTWKWWSYWQQNPNGWKQQQTNTWSGGPYWHRTGYF